MKKRIIMTTVFSLTISIIFGFAFTDQQNKQSNLEAKVDHCIACHKEIDMMPDGYSENDVHVKANLTCAGCHGGDPTSDDQEVAMSPTKGFVGVPKRKDIPQFCGKCHSNINFMRVYQPRMETDQVAQYYTSVHGKKLQQGDENVAECASCHTAHGIYGAKDPRSTVYKLNVPNTCSKCHGDEKLMKEYNIPTNQLEEYSKSVHGVALLKNQDLGAPACNDCHGNHGAMPPGITSISYVCGTCHVSNMEYFNASKMAKAFQELDYHACEQCHGNHNIQKPIDEMVGIGKESKCTDCHSEGDEGYKASEEMYNSIMVLKDRYNEANNKYLEVKQKGMNDVDIGFLLQDAKQDLIQSRTLIHTFDTSKVAEKTSDGNKISDKAIVLADAQIDEYYTRRNGFAIATVVFLIFAAALYLKIKDKSKKT